MAASTPTLASDEPGQSRPAVARGAGSPRERLARLGLVGVTVLALAAFAVYAAHLASRVDEVVVGDPVPISVPGGGTVSGPFGTGVPAPNFTLQTADGKTVQLSDFAGRPVWINIWASWCAPCRAEMPDIEQVIRDTGGGIDGTGPVVLLISLGEDPADVQRYLATTRYQLPVLLDPQFSISRDYRVTGLPTHFFIDRQGIVRDIAIGALKPNGMRARLAKVSA